MPEKAVPCPALNFAVDGKHGAELRLRRDKLPPPFHWGHHLHGLVPHLVWFTRRVAINQLANPNEFKKHEVAVVIPVVVFSFCPSSFGVRQRGAAIRCTEMNQAFLAQAPLSGPPTHHDAILEQQCCRVSVQGWAFFRHGPMSKPFHATRLGGSVPPGQLRRKPPSRAGIGPGPIFHKSVVDSKDGAFPVFSRGRSLAVGRTFKLRTLSSASDRERPARSRVPCPVWRPGPESPALSGGPVPSPLPCLAARCACRLPNQDGVRSAGGARRPWGFLELGFAADGKHCGQFVGRESKVTEDDASVIPEKSNRRGAKGRAGI